MAGPGAPESWLLLVPPVPFIPLFPCLLKRLTYSVCCCLTPLLPWLLYSSTSSSFNQWMQIVARVLKCGTMEPLENFKTIELSFKIRLFCYKIWAIACHAEGKMICRLTKSWFSRSHYSCGNAAHKSTQGKSSGHKPFLKQAITKISLCTLSILRGPMPTIHHCGFYFPSRQPMVSC